MFGQDKATAHRVLARVVPRPEFAGTLHDDAMARALGYPAALVPGIDIYAYLAGLALAAWGSDWLWRGALRSHSLRPVYDGQALDIEAGPIARGAAGDSVELVVRNPDGTVVAEGRAQMAAAPRPLPDLKDFPLLPRPSRVPPGAPEDLRPGLRFSAQPETVTPEQAARAAGEFFEPSALYRDEGIVHPGFLQRYALRQAHASFAHATPPIYIWTEGEHYAPARAGQPLNVSGAIVRLWERKGHHYMESDQLVVAGEPGREHPVMRVRRATIYQARRADAADGRREG